MTMNSASEVFRRLTKGCNFSGTKTKAKKRKLSECSPSKEEEFKQENVIIKQEFNVKEAENEEEQEEIQLLSNMSPRKAAKKIKLIKDESKIALLEQEKINEYRNKLKINVVGRNIPNPIKTFEEMNLRKKLYKNLIKCGYKEPTPIQQQAIPCLLENRQILASAATGSGKSLAFLLPIFQALKKPKNEGFRAVILCPTRELAKQTQKLAMRITENMNFHIHIISKTNNKKLKELYGQKNKKKNYDLLIVTPNRLCYLLKENLIDLSNVQWLVADEADKYFEDSSNDGFLDQFITIFKACNSEKSNCKIAFFAATYTPKAIKWCVHNIKGLIRITVGIRNSAVNSVDQKLIFVGSESGKLLELKNLLIQGGFEPPCLIFVQSKERAKQLFKELCVYQDKIKIDAIHADLNQNERDLAVKKFREGTSWVLICTELMSRGIDFKGVNLVINWDLPQTTISYIHRIGRAGRAGRRGKAVMFYTQDDLEYVASIGYLIKQSGCEVPEYVLGLKKPSKKAKKQLKVSAPKREQISTTPIYETVLQNKKKRYVLNTKLKKLAEEKGTTIQQELKELQKLKKGKNQQKNTKKIINKKNNDKKIIKKKSNKVATKLNC